MSNPDQAPPPPEHPSRPPEASPLEPALRAAKTFLWPFMLSMAMAFVGARRDIDWLYYAGLGGVAVSMIGLFLWLVRP
jgi:hypothetical protein